MRTLFGYKTAWGNKWASVFPHAGPARYEQVALGSPSSSQIEGGDTLEAVQAGFKKFDFVVGGISDDALYRVEAIPVGDSSDPSAAPQSTYKLMWTVVATGAEVADNVDLSGSVVRLLGIGPV